MEAIIRGALAGLMATAPMTAVLGVGRLTGWLHTPPPAQITANVAGLTGESPQSEDPQFQAVWLAAHFAYGASCGALFAAIRPVMPRSNLIAGSLFGGGVWAISYLGLLPSLELFPSAKDDSPRRQAVMIAGHLVYGASLAACARLLRAE